MRILLINHSYFGGGAERCVRELHQGLLRQGHEVEVWIANATENLPPGVKPICHSWEKNLRPLDMAANLTDWRHRGSIEALKTITPENFDLIHIHSINGGWISLSALSQACERVPAVWTLHDEWALTNGYICDLTGKVPKAEVLRHSRGLGKMLGRSPYHDNFKNRRVGNLLDRFAPRSPLLIAPSKHVLAMIHRCPRFKSSRSTHVYHGLSMLQEQARQMTRLEARKKWGIDPAVPVVLMVAAHLHDVHKGIHLGLEAIRKISPQMAPHVFLLGKQAGALAERLPEGRVTTAYASDNAQLASAYRAADVTLIPSLGEALSFVALESLACQTPLVTFRIGGPAEIVGDHERGLTADPFDTDQMASHLEALLSNPERRTQLGMQGCHWVEENCNMSTYVDRILGCYHDEIAAFNQEHAT